MRTIAVLILTIVLVPIALAQTETPAWRNGPNERGCGLGTYHDGLTSAFKNATSSLGETLVTVQVLPSFQRESALVLKRRGSEVRLFRVTFQDQLWTTLGPPMHVRRSRQECLDLASAAKVDTFEVAVQPEISMQLWQSFREISLESAPCPHRGKKCIAYLDGTSYVVQTQDGSPILISETGNMKDVTSENPGLLEWIHKLRDLAASSPQSVVVDQSAYRK